MELKPEQVFTIFAAMLSMAAQRATTAHTSEEIARLAWNDAAAFSEQMPTDIREAMEKTDAS